MTKIKKNDKIKYIKNNHSVLKKNKIYVVHQVFENGIRIVTETGFCGIPNSDFIKIEQN